MKIMKISLVNTDGKKRCTNLVIYTNDQLS
jgi:hypothetical protein